MFERRGATLSVVTRLLLAGAALAVGGCGGGGSPPSREEQIVAAVNEAGKLVPLGPNRDSFTSSEPVLDGDYKKVTEVHDALRNLESVVYLGLNDDLVWPGALVKGTLAHQFVFEPISVPRGPLTLSMSLEGTGTSALFRTVPEPSLSSVREAVSQLVATGFDAGVTVPARVDFRKQQVTNTSQLNLALGADVSYGAGSIDTQFDWASATRQTKMLVQYTQVYYTVDLNTPAGPLSFFGDQVTGADVAAAMPPGSLPLYVSSVSYGMMAVMCIETDFTAEEMRVALDAAYSGAVDVEVRFGYTAQQVLEKSKIAIIVYGGATKGLGDIESGYEGFLKVIHASQQYGRDTPGLPISYKFRHVSDNTLAMVSLTSQYTLVRPVQVRQRVVVRAERFVCEMSDDEGVANDVDMNAFVTWVTGYQGDPLAAIPPGEVEISRYQGADITTGVGYIFPVGQEQVVVFDTETYDLSEARLLLKAFANDYDSASGDEAAYGTLSLTGSQIFEGGGLHNVMLYSSDFTYRAEFSLRDGTLP